MKSGFIEWHFKNKMGILNSRGQVFGKILINIFLYDNTLIGIVVSMIQYEQTGLWKNKFIENRQPCDEHADTYVSTPTLLGDEIQVILIGDYFLEGWKQWDGKLWIKEGVRVVKWSIPY